MSVKFLFVDTLVVCIVSIALVGCTTPPRALAEDQSPDIPGWLKAHVGTGEGQIAAPVLQRARALYQRKQAAGVVRNPCYFAMDATRPHTAGNGGPGRRFYIICEAQRSFRAVSSGHGGGRSLDGIGSFRNGRRCAKHFSNALSSRLTAGGVYITRETRTSFKGYYRVSGGGRRRWCAPSSRSTGKARPRTQSGARSAGIRPC